MKTFLILSLAFVWFESYCQSSKYVFVFLHKNDSSEILPKDQVTKIMEGHLENINRLAKEGKLLAAGPFDGGGGMFILNTTSIVEAKEWLSTDPGIQANRWNIEMLPYTPETWSAICPVKEPYEMIAYFLVRFTQNKSKQSTKANNEVLSHHQDYIIEELRKSGILVTGGIFDSPDKFVISKENIAEKLVAFDQAVRSGALKIDVRKLWIARGSFCEQ